MKVSGKTEKGANTALFGTVWTTLGGALLFLEVPVSKAKR